MLDRWLGGPPSWEQKRASIIEELGARPLKRINLERFRQDESIYTHGQHSDHAGLHSARVLVIVNAGISALIRRDVVLPETIQTALSWTAVRHDTQIPPDWRGHYRVHGRYAAEWVEKNMRDTMDPGILSLTQYYCYYHHFEDRDTPKADDQMVETGMRLFKDSDAVDRVRIPRYNFGARLDEGFLRLPVTKDILLPVAKELFRRTGERLMPVKEAFNLVFDQAIAMGIVQ